MQDYHDLWVARQSVDLKRVSKPGLVAAWPCMDLPVNLSGRWFLQTGSAAWRLSDFLGGEWKIGVPRADPHSGFGV